MALTEHGTKQQAVSLQNGGRLSEMTQTVHFRRRKRLSLCDIVSASCLLSDILTVLLCNCYSIVIREFVTEDAISESY